MHHRSSHDELGLGTRNIVYTASAKDGNAPTSVAPIGKNYDMDVCQMVLAARTLLPG